MAKKSAHKRVKRTSKRKSSFFEKYFTFPKLAFGLFVILLIIFIYQVTLPDIGVKGASTSLNLKAIESSAQTSGSSTQFYTYVDVFKDINGDARENSNEVCVPGNHAFTVTSNGIKKTEYLYQQSQNCGEVWIQDNFHKCKTVTIKPVSGYKVTGLFYKDGVTGNRIKVIKGSSSQQLCGAAFWYNNGDNLIGFGLQKK